MGRGSGCFTYLRMLVGQQSLRAGGKLGDGRRRIAIMDGADGSGTGARHLTLSGKSRSSGPRTASSKGLFAALNAPWHRDREREVSGVWREEGICDR